MGQLYLEGVSVILGFFNIKICIKIFENENDVFVSSLLVVVLTFLCGRLSKL